MNDEQLTRDIANYKKNAFELEIIRKDLVVRIEKLMKDKIIPEIEPLLPEYYSICREDSEVTNNHSVPIYFGLELRVHYDNKPIGDGDEDSNRIAKIQHDVSLCKKLDEISKKYNLGFVIFFGEGGVIG